MIGYDTRNLHIELSRLPACQQVVQTMTHLRYEDCHARLLVVEVQTESHLVALCIERFEVFLDLLTRYEELVEFPFNAHEEHSILTVNILVEIDDVAVVIRDELGYFCDDARLIRAVQKHNCCGFHSFFCYCSFNSPFIYRVQRYE